MELSKREKRRLRLEKLRQESGEAQKEYEQRLEQQNAIIQKPKRSKLVWIAAIVGLLIIAIGAYSVYSLNKPGNYDNFAKCLAEKGAVMYGAMDWCKYTQGQKAMFGNSFKYINYHEFGELPDIKKTPTWVINGKWYENAQPFEKLSELTGCKIK